MSSHTTTTRRQIIDAIIGVPKDFSGKILPTHEDVLKCYLGLRHELKHDSKKEPTVFEISNALTLKLKEIWQRASIPTLSDPRIKLLIKKYHNNYMNLMKQPKAKLNSDTYKKNLRNFRENAKIQLFDIAACKCEFTSCKCEKIRKVPITERTFLTDQRSHRKMFIGNVDFVTTKKLAVREERKRKDNTTVTARCEAGGSGLFSKSKEMSPDESNFNQESSSDNDNESDQITDQINVSEPTQKRKRLDIGESFNQPGTSTKESTSKLHQPQMRVKLPTLAKTCDRFGVSNRAAAAIASAVLQDIGAITKEYTSKVIDKRKIQRERLKVRNELRKTDKSRLICALFFDGRKDKTLGMEVNEGKHHRRIIIEEHLSLIEEPGSQYLGHVTPSSGSAENIKEAILNFFRTNDVSLEHLICIGCDGTNVNTGIKGGVIRLLELELKRPLQWFICQLHGNELTLRHLFQYLDGGTTGPRNFSGCIGKSLENCLQLPLVEFESIECELPAIDKDTTDISTDQKYLLDMCHAISSGYCSVGFSKREPGKLSHARWLTTANRILRVYIGTKAPSNNLKILVVFILKVYAPLWFQIKTHPSCKDGARHTWMSINLTRYLSKDLKKIVDPVIQRNAYFAHPENILLSMVTDDRRQVRELGLRRILKSRANPSQSMNATREFKIPLLNFNATDYIDMINWHTTKITEPPIVTDKSDEELQLLIGQEQTPVLNFLRYPCHTQSVERCVKLVTEASMSVVGSESRDGYIRATIKSRQDLPSFETKSHFQVV